MKNLSLFIAWRYIRARNREKNISIMVRVCFLGISIGTFALALVASITNGFEKATHEKMQGIHPQIMISARGNQLDFKAFQLLFSQDFPEIIAAAPSHEAQVMLEDPTTQQVQHVMAIKGISPKLEEQVSSLATKLMEVQPGTPLEAVMEDNKILIGTKAAQSLNLKVGDSINILFAPEEQQGKKITLNIKSAVIGGIFNTGIDEYDSNVIFAPLGLLRTIFPESGITQLDIKLQQDAPEDIIIDRLRKRLPSLDVYSWKELYPALVSALKLEKYVNFFIIALITLVASLNIISLLFMQITQKRSDIAILQALGAHQKTIRAIFLWMGMSISFCATIVGLLLSIIASWILEHYPFISLPDVYYVTHLPSRMENSLLIIVFCVVMLISFISTWIPARKISSIKIADVLRFEA